MIVRTINRLPEIADNLLSWKHSGFHVHASHPFLPSERALVRTRLACAFRPAVAIGRLGFDGKTVTVATRKQTLHLHPVEFLAKLTLHIPDRYQNARRYAGFYASIVQCRVRAAAGKENHHPDGIEIGAPVRPKWAALIAKIFGEMPLTCPKCGQAMDLKEFVVSAIPIARLFPEIARAPPRLEFGRYVPPAGGLVYGCPENEPADADFDQSRPNDDAIFNQDIA